MFEKVFKRLGYEKKDAPDYGVSNSWWPRYLSWGWSRELGRTDFSEQVGSLDTSSLVMAVVNDTGTALAEALPSIKIPDKSGKFTPDSNHEIAQLIQHPNPFNIWAEYCGALSLSWWIDGNVYFYKAKDATGQTRELWYLPHFLVEERWPDDRRTPEVPGSGKNAADNEYLSHYQYNIPNKQPILFRKDEIVHIKRFVDPNNPRRGIGPFAACITELYGDRKAAEFAATILKNLGIMVPIISPKDKDVTLTETQAMAIKEKYVQQTTGANVGLPIVNTVGIEVAKFSFSPQELDLKELRKIPESRIAAVTRYPAAYLQFLVGLENGTSYASYKQAREQAYEQVVIPIQRVIEENVTWQLVREFDEKARFFFDNSEVRVLQEDRDTLYTREVNALRAGGSTLNEFLQAIGKDMLPEDIGDIRYVPIGSKPMNPEQLIEAASTGSSQPAIPVDPTQLAKFAEMEVYFQQLEEQMKGFRPQAINRT